MMRKMGEIMKDLGFNEESSDGAKVAFIKNLIRQAYGVEVQSSPRLVNVQTLPELEAMSAPERKPLPDHLPARQPQQLSFEFELEMPVSKKNPA
jgi:hypothetical protein